MLYMWKILAPFEEEIKMVSYDEAWISDTIPLIFPLKHTLHDH